MKSNLRRRPCTRLANVGAHYTERAARWESSGPLRVGAPSHPENQNTNRHEFTLIDTNPDRVLVRIRGESCPFVSIRVLPFGTRRTRRSKGSPRPARCAGVVAEDVVQLLARLHAVEPIRLRPLLLQIAQALGHRAVRDAEGRLREDHDAVAHVGELSRSEEHTTGLQS